MKGHSPIATPRGQPVRYGTCIAWLPGITNRVFKCRLYKRERTTTPAWFVPCTSPCYPFPAAPSAAFTTPQQPKQLENRPPQQTPYPHPRLPRNPSELPLGRSSLRFGDSALEFGSSTLTDASRRSRTRSLPRKHASASPAPSSPSPERPRLQIPRTHRRIPEGSRRHRKQQ